jgi:hypothetical protein
MCVEDAWVHADVEHIAIVSDWRIKLSIWSVAKGLQVLNPARWERERERATPGSHPAKEVKRAPRWPARID